jgi:tail protein P2 I
MISIEIIDPLSGTTFTGPANIILSALVTSTKPILNVQFFAGPNLIGTVPPVVTAFGPLVSGTVTITNASASVVGSFTTFTTDFAVGNYLIFTSQPSMLYQILSIADNTHLTLSTPFTGTTITGDTVRSVTLFDYFNYAWNNVQLGNYSLTAVATDITGAIVTTMPTVITVIGNINPPPNATLKGSSIGFGHNPFGNSEFGYGDWSEEMLWNNMPEFYREADASSSNTSVVPNPLRNFVNALKPSYEDLRDKWGNFPTLWDAEKVPIGSLPQLAYTVGLTLDPTKPENLQRSTTLNASQLWLNKGTDSGYRIAAAFEGLLVTITPLWAESCGASPQLLGTIGSVAAPFNLATTAITAHPVTPGTIDIAVTTAQNLPQTITDDQNGNLVGNGTQPNGPLTKLFVTSAYTLHLTGVVVGVNGNISIGDTLTQGAATGIVLDVVGFLLKVQVTAGAFTPSVSPNDLVDTSRPGTTATIGSESVDSLTIGETALGLTSRTLATVEDNNQTANPPANPVQYLLIDSITTNAGFTPGEPIVGQTSGDYMIAGTSHALVQGPLRETLTFAIPITVSSIVGTFSPGDTILRTAATAISAASNGFSLPQSTINVSSTAGFPAYGVINVTTGAGVQTVSYAGTTGTSFTGCIGGTGLMSTGGAVTSTASTASGTIISIVGSVFNMLVTYGAFTTGAITDAQSGATATVTAVNAPVTGAFITAAIVSGAPSGATGIIRAVTANSIQVEVITTPNFATGDTLTQAGSSPTTAIIGNASFGSINYLTGTMTGTTWSLAPNSVVNADVILTTTAPTQFLPQYDLVPADLIPVDDVQTDQYGLWPIYSNPISIINGILTSGNCRSYSLRLFFFAPNNTEIENFVDVANSLVAGLQTFQPIHVRLDSVTFSGTTAPSQLWWTNEIIAESFAINTWTVNITATEFASSQIWTMSTMTATPTI